MLTEQDILEISTFVYVHNKGSDSQFARAIEAAVLAKLREGGAALPQEFEVFTEDVPNSIIHGFTEAQLLDYGDRRVAAVLAKQAAIAQQKEAHQKPVVVNDDIVAGALYDFLGYLTTRRTRITMSDRDDAGAAVDALVDWSKTRKINLVEARVYDWNTYTTPPNHIAVLTMALEALIELTECGGEAWSADRPCVKDGYAAIAAIREVLP